MRLLPCRRRWLLRNAWNRKTLVGRIVGCVVATLGGAICGLVWSLLWALVVLGTVDWTMETSPWGWPIGARSLLDAILLLPVGAVLVLAARRAPPGKPNAQVACFLSAAIFVWCWVVLGKLWRL